MTQLNAKKQGFADVIYLDAVENKYVEEVSSCNIFVVKVPLWSCPYVFVLFSVPISFRVRWFSFSVLVGIGSFGLSSSCLTLSLPTFRGYSCCLFSFLSRLPLLSSPVLAVTPLGKALDPESFYCCSENL